MSAEDALKYGLIDEIVQPNDEKIRSMALPPPASAPQLFGQVPDDAENYEFGKLVRLAPFLTRSLMHALTE
jgi:enoyl-CoA hydratase/carnithine racemase